MSIPEKRFREELWERIYKDVNDWFLGRDLAYPLMNSSGEYRNKPLRKIVKIPKKNIAKYIYEEVLRKTPWLEEYGKPRKT